MGTGLSLDANDQVVTTTSNSLDIHRTIMGDLPVSSGNYQYEVYFWSQSRSSLANLLSFGVAQTSSSLVKYVGEEATSFGWRTADGGVYSNNAVLSAVPVQDERVLLGIYLALSPSSCTCSFVLNQSSVYTAALPLGKAWLPALSIGSASAGDVSAACNFGLDRFDGFGPTYTGWSTLAPGLNPIYVSLVTDAFMSSGADLPPNTPFGPYIVNGRQLTIKRNPQAYVHRGTGRTNPAALITLTFDNSEGTFNALRSADVRDSTMVLQVVKAPAGGTDSIAKAATMFTGIVESVTQPTPSTIEVVLRDTLSRFDKPLRCRKIPQFYDESAAGQIWPIGLGAQRNIEPILLDSPSLLYGLGDAPMSNVQLVSDKAEPLDPIASPPQYVPALNGAAMTLRSQPVGRLAADVSSVGQQYINPGAVDILGGIGAFTTWAGLPSQPLGWTKATAAGIAGFGSISQTSSYGTSSALRISSFVPYTLDVGGNYYGYTVESGIFLQPGRSHRVTFKLLYALGSSANGNKFGFAILSKLVNDARYWITPFRSPLNQHLGAQTYTFEYRHPSFEPAAELYLVVISAMDAYFNPQAVPNLSAPSCVVVIDDLKVELVPEFLAVPMQGITLKDAFTEVLVNRAGEDPSVFSAADCAAIDAVTNYPLGFRWTEVPNILDMLTQIADAVGAAIFTDAFGVVRVRRLSDPSTGAVVASFGKGTIDTDSFRIWRDPAPGLTISFAARPNCVPFQPGDFTTDTPVVTPTIVQQYQGPAQFNLSASVRLAQEYQGAAGAARRVLAIDDSALASTEANRMLAPFSTVMMCCQFYARYGDDLLLGADVQVLVPSLAYMDVFTLDLPELGLSAVRMAVLTPELYIGDNRVLITGWFRFS